MEYGAKNTSPKQHPKRLRLSTSMGVPFFFPLFGGVFVLVSLFLINNIKKEPLEGFPWIYLVIELFCVDEYRVGIKPQILIGFGRIIWTCQAVRQRVALSIGLVLNITAQVCSP